MKKENDPLDARKLDLKTGGLLGLIPNGEESPSEQEAAHKKMQEMLNRVEKEKIEKTEEPIIEQKDVEHPFISETEYNNLSTEDKELADKTRTKLEWQKNYKKWRDEYFNKHHGSTLSLKTYSQDEELTPEEQLEKELEEKVTGPQIGPKGLPSVSLREPGATSPPTVPSEVLEEVGYQPRTPEESRKALEEMRKKEEEKTKKEPEETKPEGKPTLLDRLQEIKRQRAEEIAATELERLEGYYGRLDEFNKVMQELEPLGKTVTNANANIESAKSLIESSNLGEVTKERAAKNFAVVPPVVTLRNFAITQKGSLTEEGERDLAAIMPKDRKIIEEWIENTSEGQKFEQEALNLYRIRKVEQLLSNSILSMQNLKVIQKKMPPGVEEGEFLSQQTKMRMKDQKKEQERKDNIQKKYEPVIKEQFYKIRNAETPAEKAAVDKWLESPEGKSSKDRIMNRLITTEEEKQRKLKNIVRKKDVGKLPEDASKFLLRNFENYDQFTEAVAGLGEFSPDTVAWAKELYNTYPTENIKYILEHKIPLSQKPKYFPRKKRTSLSLKKFFSKLNLRKNAELEEPTKQKEISEEKITYPPEFIKQWNEPWVGNAPPSIEPGGGGKFFTFLILNDGTDEITNLHIVSADSEASLRDLLKREWLSWFEGEDEEEFEEQINMLSFWKVPNEKVALDIAKLAASDEEESSVTFDRWLEDIENQFVSIDQLDWITPAMFTPLMQGPERRLPGNLPPGVSKTLNLRKTSDTNGPGGDDWSYEYLDNSPSKVTDPKERRKHRFHFHNQPSVRKPGEGEQGNLFDVGPLGGQSDMNYLSSIFNSMTKTADNDIFESYIYSTNKGSWITYTLFKKASNVFKEGDVVVQYGLTKEDSNTFRRRFGSVSKAKKNIQKALISILADVVGIPTPNDSLSEIQTGTPGFGPYKKRIDYDKPEGDQRDGFDFTPPKRKNVKRPFIPFMDTPDSEGVGFGDQQSIQGNKDKIEKKANITPGLTPQVETPEDRAWKEQPDDASISAANPRWLMPPRRKRPTELNETQLYNGQYAEEPRMLLSNLNLKKQSAEDDENKIKWFIKQIYPLINEYLVSFIEEELEPEMAKAKLTDNMSRLLLKNHAILTERKYTADTISEALNRIVATLSSKYPDQNINIDLMDPKLQDTINSFPEGLTREKTKTMPSLSPEEAKYLEMFTADDIWDKAVAGDEIARSMIQKGTVASNKLNLKK